MIILAPHIDQLPSHIQSFAVTSVTDAATKAKDLGVDFFVFRPRQKEEANILAYIDHLELPSIGRAALTPHPEHVRALAASKYFKALVCVGREQYDFLMDTPLHSKLAYIDNGIHLASCGDVDVEKDPNLVAYMGALVPVKGFHQLAAAWPKVLRQCPDAKLSVIGSVKMYGDNQSVGPLGVAHEDYERTHIMPHLCDANGKLHPSVTFHGQMGAEKFAILHRATVAVANPTGQTETCCVSAVEMAACKTAVVSGAYYALLDTVLHGETGLLGRGVDDLAHNIIACLKNPEMARELGQAGYERVKTQYDFAAIAPRWIDLCQSLQSGQKPKIHGRLKNIRYHHKWLRLINRPLQAVLGRIMPWPSVLDLQSWGSKAITMLKGLKKPVV
jgi:glycosyltransferase involved in cell wall biosynthesis